MSREEATRARFEESAEKLAALADSRVDEIRARLAELVAPTGDERAIDSGTGTGAIAFALAPLVGSVVAVDLVPAMIEQARKRAPAFPNVELVVGDALALAYPDGAFDLGTTGRTLHHLERPDAAVAELARVVRPGGTVVVVDQIAADDAPSAVVQEEIERLRDPSHVRTLPDDEIRSMLARAGLDVVRVHVVDEDRDLDEFLALAGCAGETRERVLALAADAVALGPCAGLDLRREADGFRFRIRVGWYLARRAGA